MTSEELFSDKGVCVIYISHFLITLKLSFEAQIRKTKLGCRWFESVHFSFDNHRVGFDAFKDLYACNNDFWEIVE